MKTGVFDSRMQFHELPFYEIQGLMKYIVCTAAKRSPKYAELYEKYKKKITRFSPEIEFCLHELGWMIYDPFFHQKDEVLFSNGNRCYLASTEYVSKPEFDRKSINVDLGYPILTDENIKFDSKMNPENMSKGIIDSRGYVDARFAGSLDNLAEIELMEELTGDKDKFVDYMRFRDRYTTSLEYITSKKNVIAARKLEDGTFVLQFISENDGKVQRFINRIKNEGRIAELVPITQDESRSIMKVA